MVGRIHSLFQNKTTIQVFRPNPLQYKASLLGRFTKVVKNTMPFEDLASMLVDECSALAKTNRYTRPDKVVDRSAVQAGTGANIPLNIVVSEQRDAAVKIMFRASSICAVRE